MKKVMIFGILIAGVYLASCNTNEVAPTDNTTITASSARTAATDSAGKHSKDTIAISALPVAITSYITTAYPAATIHRASLRKDGTYSVIIIDAAGIRKGLKFDATGVFVSEFIKTDKHIDGAQTKDSTHTGGGKGKKGKGGKG
jgi:hypothetical protein